MKRMLFNATYQEELRVAMVDGQKLVNFDIETSSKALRRGNIYKGVVTRVEPSLEACFVDYGTEKQGFLPFKEINNHHLLESNFRNRDFSQIKEGIELIVQIEKDERGNKGAALTTFISIPGRYLVLMPNNSRSGGISRRIDGNERDELKTLLNELVVPDGMSVIARTAALGRAAEELSWDLDYLLKLWAAIKNIASTRSGGFLIYQESNLVIRSIRDHFSPDIAEILIDKEDVYQQAHQFIANVMPNYLSRVRFYNDDSPLFSRFQVEHQIESVYARTVDLPSGGSVVIDRAEALTAIDVNSAKSNKNADIETTALLTNMEAAEEIARQLRLRDLGGLIVVDFIDMENTRNQREVEAFFKQQLTFDRARVQIGRISRFGLLELSRQRLQASLGESTTISCPRCMGTGFIRGVESVAVHVLRIIQEEIVKHAHQLTALHVQLPVNVATYLLNEKRQDVWQSENRHKVKIILIPNHELESPDYKIRRVGRHNSDALLNKNSYDLVDNVEQQYTYSNNSAERRNAEDEASRKLMSNLVPMVPAPVLNKSVTKLIVAKIKSLFGGGGNSGGGSNTGFIPANKSNASNASNTSNIATSRSTANSAENIAGGVNRAFTTTARVTSGASGGVSHGSVASGLNNRRGNNMRTNNANASLPKKTSKNDSQRFSGEHKQPLPPRPRRLKPMTGNQESAAEIAPAILPTNARSTVTSPVDTGLAATTTRPPRKPPTGKSYYTPKPLDVSLEVHQTSQGSKINQTDFVTTSATVLSNSKVISDSIELKNDDTSIVTTNNPVAKSTTASIKIKAEASSLNATVVDADNSGSRVKKASAKPKRVNTINDNVDLGAFQLIDTQVKAKPAKTATKTTKTTMATTDAFKTATNLNSQAHDALDAATKTNGVNDLHANKEAKTTFMSAMDVAKVKRYNDAPRKKAASIATSDAATPQSEITYELVETKK